MESNTGTYVLACCMLYDKNFHEEIRQTCLVILDKEPMKNQDIDITQIQSGEPMCFIGVIRKHIDVIHKIKTNSKVTV